MKREPGYYWLQFRANPSIVTIGEWSGYSWDVLGMTYFGEEDEYKYNIHPIPIESPFK